MSSSWVALQRLVQGLNFWLAGAAGPDVRFLFLCRAAVERRSLLFARRLLVEPASFEGSMKKVTGAVASSP